MHSQRWHVVHVAKPADQAVHYQRNQILFHQTAEPVLLLYDDLLHSAHHHWQ